MEMVLACREPGRGMGMLGRKSWLDELGLQSIEAGDMAGTERRGIFSTRVFEKLGGKSCGSHIYVLNGI